MTEIHWLDSLDKGLSKARGEDKLVFLDFFSPN